MADFNSKYSGEQVEALLDIVSEGGIGGGGGEGEVQKTTEAEITAMGFTKNLGTITEVKMNGVTKGTSGVVDLGAVITEHQDISGKQEKITDLDAIRSGAEKGATALQSVPSEYVTDTELNNKGYATILALNDKVDKVSGKQLSTEDFTSALKTKLEGLSNYDDTEIENAITSLQTQFNTLVSGNASDAINSFNEIVAFLDGVKDTEDLSSIIASIEQQIAGKMDKVTLAKVATTGSYNDLSNKPTIPSEVTESTVSGWGFTKNTGTVTKVKVNGNEKTPDANGVVDLGTIEGGTASSTGNYPVITVFDTESINLSPNTYYINKIDMVGIPNIDITLNREEEITGQVNEYIIEINLFDTFGNEPIPCSFPEEIIWANESVPTFEVGHAYVISIVNNLAVFAEF
jgi:hypothetical protein